MGQGSLNDDGTVTVLDAKGQPVEVSPDRSQQQKARGEGRMVTVDRFGKVSPAEILAGPQIDPAHIRPGSALATLTEAVRLIESLTPSREASLARTRAQEALFWLNAIRH